MKKPIPSRSVHLPRAGRRAFWPRAVRGAGFAAAWLFAASCSGPSIDLGPAGLTPDTVEKVSLVVGQTRAQFPQHSGGAIPYQIREADPDALPKPELALQGGGVSMTPGLQQETSRKITLSLFLDKEKYAVGWVQVTLPSGAREKWPVVAFEKTGAPDDDFGFTYVLVTPTGQLRYLAVIGGRYEDGEKTYLGFEGTLVIPGKNHDLEHWKRAYKVNFGYKFSDPPAYQVLVARATGLFQEVGAEVKRVERIRGRISEVEGRIATLRVRPPVGGSEGERGQAMAAAAEEMNTLENEMAAFLSATEAKFLLYYRLREEIAGAYAAFVATNHYRWQDQDGKQDFFDRWKLVEFHHPRIDEMVLAFMVHAKDKGTLDLTRARAMKTITGHNNWSKNPER